MGELLEAALTYAARGWPVLACRRRSKVPLLGHGLHDATIDPDQIRAWWERWPAANVGLVTGVCFDVLDVDGPDGERALAGALPAAEAPPVDGPTVATGKGWHVYVAPTGLGNRAGVVPHVDWRGAGGYVIAPPSVHPSGARYCWEFPGDPLFGPEAPLRPAPSWLLELLAPSRHPLAGIAPRSSPTGDTYGRRALEGELGRLATAPVGERNSVLHAASLRLGQLVAAGQLDAGEATAGLAAVAQRVGLADREIEGTVRSGLTFGIAHPRPAR